MRSRRLAAVAAVTALLLGLLPAVGIAGPAEFRLVPPAGQTAVKAGDVVGVEGTADADADVRGEQLVALDAAGTELGRYDLGGLVTNSGGTLSGSFTVACGLIPGCPDDPELRASVDAYRLEATVVSSADTHEVASQDLEFDEQDPSIVGYFLIAPDQIEVRFSEDVADPDGDTRSDWEVEGLRQVTEITGEGDRRVLRTLSSFDRDATPEVRYVAQSAVLPGQLPNQPYLDEAGNDLLARNRFRDAADRVPPTPPTITAIAGAATSRDDDGQAVPVLGSDATPTVTVGDMVDGHTARVWLDDGDGTLEDDRDTLVGEAVASGGSAEVAWPDGLALPDGDHRLFARALDRAACDPTDPSAGTCPNSARSQDALYDLDTTPPALIGPALASTSAITVVVDEAVTGPDDPADWTVTNPDGSAGPEVTGVSGSGDSRVLEVAGVLTESTLTYLPSGARYEDSHGNQLPDSGVRIAAAPIPTLRLVDAAATEQDGPSGPLDLTYEEAQVAFRLELSDPVRFGETAEVTFRVVGQDATPGDDYTDPGEFTVEVPQGAPGADVPVELVGDQLDEFDETFLLQVVSTNEAVTVADPTATGTITDDDELVSVSVGDVSVTEGGTATVTVAASAPTGKDVVAEWSLRPVSASAGDDYEAASGTVTIPGDGATTSATVDVPALQDQLDEPDAETLELVLGEVTNATVDDGVGVVTIEDDDPLPSLRITDVTTFEGDQTRTVGVVVTLSEVSGRDVEVGYDTADGTATAGADYTAASGTVTIPAGASGVTLALDVLGDTAAEGDEEFTVTLRDAGNATLGDDTAVVTLLEDDGGLPPVVLDVTGGEVEEDAGGLFAALFPAEATWTLTLSEAADGPIQVRYRTSDEGDARTGEDFEGVDGTIEIPAGQTSVELSADVIDDALDEFDETVALVVEQPAGAVLANGEATLTTTSTITDDDPLPGVAFSDDTDAVVVTEGDPATFTVELDAPSGREVTVDWATDLTDATADGADVPSQSGTVTVPAGATTADFEVATLDDTDPETDEVATIALSAPQFAELDESRAVEARLTLADDEVVLPTIALTGGTGDEDPGALPPLTSPTAVPFTVELSEAAPGDVTVSYRTTSDGTATAESDFTGASGTVTIPQGETSATIDVAVVDDALDEFEETVELELSRPVNARLPDGEDSLLGTGGIADDDPVVVASLGDDATVGEGDTAVVDVTLDTPSGKRVLLDYTTVDQSTDGDDYVTTSGRIELEPGETSASISVPTRDDADAEGDEDFRIELTAVDEETAGIGDGELVVTIVDSAIPDGNVVSLSSATVEEGDPVGPFPAPVPTRSLDFAVRLAEPAAGEVVLSFTAAAGTATPGEDVELDEGTVTFADGTQEATISLDTYTDLLDETDETVTVTVELQRGDAVVPGGQLVRSGRILDDDPLVSVAYADDSTDVGVTEGDDVTLTVELDEVSGKDVEIDWSTSYNGAADAADVDAQSGTVLVPAGQQAATFRVRTLDDTVDEPDEALDVVLSSPANATFDGRASTATVILVDDDLNAPVLSIEGGSVDEGAAGPLALLAPAQLVWDVTLDEAPEQDVTVEWRTLDSGTARAGSDFTAASGTLEVPAGETTAQLVVDVLDDDLDEFTESVVLRLSDPQGVAFDGGGPTLTENAGITDDDPLVTVALGDDVEVAEGEPATFDVALDAASGKDVTLRVRTADGTAAAPGDYATTDRTFTIPAGQTSATVTVPTRDDSAPEPGEELQVTLEVVQDDTAELGRAAATLAITDDDLGVQPGDVVVSLTGASVEEGDPFTPLGLPVGSATLDFVVGLSEPADGDVTIAWQTVPGTATADEDFVAGAGDVTIADGEQETTVSVEVVPDTLDEPDEDLQLVLTEVTGDAVLPGDELARTGRILDDDPAPLLRVADATVLEGQVAAVEVTLDRASDRDVTVAWALSPGSADTADYQDAGGTLEFPAGTTSRTLDVATLADGTTELIEQFELVLSSPTNAGLDDPRGTISIVDLLGGQTAVYLEDVTVTEADDDRTVEVPVVLSNERDQDTVVTWTTQALTASTGDDFRADGGQVTIPAGATSARIRVVVVGDDAQELTEDFLVLLTEAEGAVITGPAGRVTIEDDDADEDGGGDPDDGGDGSDGDGDGAGGGVGSDGDAVGAPGGDLPATGGGAGLAVIALAALLARRRRD